MKNLFISRKTLTLGICSILSASIFMSCAESPKEKLDDATTEVVDASEDLAKAKENYLAEVVAFKADAQARIVENEKIREEYNTDLKIKKTKELKKKIEDLKEKTASLKQKVLDFKAEENKESWAGFQAEINSDIEEVKAAMEDLKNAK